MSSAPNCVISLHSLYRIPRLQHRLTHYTPALLHKVIVLTTPGFPSTGFLRVGRNQCLDFCMIKNSGLESLIMALQLLFGRIDIWSEFRP